MSLHHLTIPVLLLLVFSPFSSHCQWTEQVDKLFEENIEEGGPGFAVAILKEGEVLYTQGYGLANLDYGIPISESSAFNLASVSKQFTGACIALLIQEGKLDLDMPAAAFLPILNKYEDTIRIKHLIYNTSGLEDYYRIPRKNGTTWLDFNYFSINESIEASLSLPYLKFKPGEQWDYVNTNWMLLAQIVEKVSGMSFASYVQSKLFAPLGMTNTLVHDDITLVVPNRVIGYQKRTTENVADYRASGVYVRKGEGYIQHHRNSPHYGGSGILSTLEDLCKWAANYHTRAFGGDAFYDLMHRTEAFPHGRNNQGLGLYRIEWNGRYRWAWDGGDAGFSTQMVHFPEQGVAIICLSNQGNGRAFEKVDRIADFLLDAGLL